MQGGQQLGGLGQLASGMGQQFGQIGQGIAGLGQQGQGMLGNQINMLNQLGQQGQATQQAALSRQFGAAQQLAQEPLQRLQLLQSGVGTVISGYPQRDAFVTQPDPSPLQTALGVGSTLAGIYGALNPRPLYGS